MDAHLPRAGMSPAVFSRRTGIPVHRLRHYDAQGLLVPAQVDPGTRWRRYAPGQLSGGRLLHALVRTGMPLRRAAAVVDGDDLGAVLAHIASVEELVARMRDHAPAPGAGRVVLGQDREWPGLRVAARDDVGIVEQVLQARARLAAARGTSVAELPAAETTLSADGPWVALQRTDRGLVADELLLPWPAGEPAPASWRSGWRDSGHWALLGLNGSGTADEPLGSADLAAAQDQLQARLDRPDGGIPMTFHLAFDAAMTGASLVAHYSPG